MNHFFNKIAKSNFTTMRSELEDFKREVIDSRTKKSVTIQNEILRSHQEVEIANFLYLNNIDYEYEPIYPYHIALARKPYTPDFIIKQEHLREQLEAGGFKLVPRSNKEVMEMLVAGEENRYIRKLTNLICRFISNFKVNGYTAEEFNRMYHSTQNVRTRLFL